MAEARVRTEAARPAVRLAAVDLHEPKAARRILEAQQRADVAAPIGVGAAVPKRRETCLAVLRSPLLPERAPRERQAGAAAGTCEDEAWCVRRRRSAAAAAAVQEQSGRRSDGSDAREGDLLRAGGHAPVSPRHLGASEHQRSCTRRFATSLARKGNVALLGTFSPLPRVKTSTDRPQNDLPEAAIVGDASLIFQQTLCSRRSRSVHVERVDGHWSSRALGRAILTASAAY